MSKILRRPMFRGGPVDSRGTGITSGLMDGGRVGFSNGGDYLSKLLGTDTRGYGSNNMILGGELYPQTSTSDILGMKDFLGTSRNILDKEEDVEVGTDGDIIKKTTEDIFAEQKEKKDAEKAKAKEMGVDVDTMKAIEKENLSPQSIKDQSLEKMLANQPDLSPRGNEPSSTVIDEKALIREQAELFKELLGEANEKKLKDARIQDASDYLLKFFEGSQKEGATVGSSAADVAAFATSRDSRTQRAKDSIEKGDQTATALAINDYIAGKRSKEQTDQLITKLGLSAELKKGNVKEQIRDATVKLGGSPPVSVLQSILAADGPVEVISKEQVEAGYEPAPDGSDDGKYYLEEDTKTIFKVVGNKKVRV